MTGVATIRERVQECLRQDTASFLTGDYLARLYDAESFFIERRNKLITRIALLCGLFVVIVTAAVDEVRLSGLRMRDLSLIVQAVPPIVAFTFVRLCASAVGTSLVRQTADEIVVASFPSVGDAGLNRLVGIRTTLGAERLLADWTPNRWKLGRLSVVSPAIGALIVLAFEIFAIVKCFDLYGASEPLVWISAALSFYLTIEALAFIATYYRSPLTRQA